MNSPLSVPLAPPAQLWVELSEEADRYSYLLQILIEQAHELSDENRAQVEDELVQSLSHIQMHSHVLNEILVDALELADDLEDRKLVKSEG